MPQQPNILAIFTRFPTPGTTKTRLIPRLGPDGAAALHRQMTERVLAHAKKFCSQSAAVLEIHFHGGSLEAMKQWLGPHTLIRQKGASLGDRMEHTFHTAFASGANKTVIIGTDCPGLTHDIISQAFTTLENSSLVLGPAQDGGYYLIGLTTPSPALFVNIDWGTPIVLAQTLLRAQSLTVSQLPPLHDVDRPEDLVHIDYHSHPE